jgi:hypothetical protein
MMNVVSYVMWSVACGGRMKVFSANKEVVKGIVESECVGRIAFNMAAPLPRQAQKRRVTSGEAIHEPAGKTNVPAYPRRPN